MRTAQPDLSAFYTLASIQDAAHKWLERGEYRRQSSIARTTERVVKTVWSSQLPIGTRLKAVAVLRGLTQREVARLAGIHEKTLSLVLANRRLPNDDLLSMICLALELKEQLSDVSATSSGS